MPDGAYQQLDLYSRYDRKPPSADDPVIWTAFEAIALELLADGRNYLSAKNCWERVREKLKVKMDNNDCSAYAARFRAAHPEHSGKLRTRGKA